MTCPLKKKTENLNKNFMNNNLIDKKNKPGDEQIVIADECGDTLWDAVLEQEVKACEVKTISKNAAVLLNSMNVTGVLGIHR